MEDFCVYKDIRQRTNGEIYFGIVGPVRAGKSTFIRRFMEEMVIPHMEEGPALDQTRDELPQAASGKNIMTTEPKFIPSKVAEVHLEENTALRLRMVDCVGFLIPGALGGQEEEKERLVHTPWFEYDIPFAKAAQIGTQKVIEDHSTVGLVITTDGTVTDFPREAYASAEEKTIEELKKQKKPFLVILNTKTPSMPAVRSLVKEMEEKYNVTVFPMNCASMGMEEINQLLQAILMEFPVCEIDFELPKWLEILERDHPVRQELTVFAKGILDKITRMKDARALRTAALPEHIRRCMQGALDLANGKVSYEISMKDDLYFHTVSQYAGIPISDEKMLIETLREYAGLKSQYDSVSTALGSVAQCGYGVVSPRRDQIRLEEPLVVRHGNRYGVKMKATAPAVHMIQSMVETEIAPIVGSEQQAKDLVAYIQSEASQSEDGIWNTNIFGKSIGQIVEDGIDAKIGQMSDNCRLKMQEALEKIVNDSNGGVICIII